MAVLKIKSESSVGFQYIEEEDFDPEVHQLFDPPASGKTPAKKDKPVEVKPE